MGQPARGQPHRPAEEENRQQLRRPRQPVTAKRHIVLLGDSAFDNARYVEPGASVNELMGQRLHEPDAVTLLAIVYRLPGSWLWCSRLLRLFGRVELSTSTGSCVRAGTSFPTWRTLNSSKS